MEPSVPQLPEGLPDLINTVFSGEIGLRGLLLIKKKKACIISLLFSLSGFTLLDVLFPQDVTLGKKTRLKIANRITLSFLCGLNNHQNT